MTPLKDPRILIVALKGLPISIAILLNRYEQPVTQQHLCDMIGSTDKTVSCALHKLEEFKIIAHSEEGWSVTENVNLLWASKQEAQVTPEPVDKPVDTCPADAFPQEKGRKISDSSLSSSTSSSSYLTNLKLEENLLLQVLEPENSEKFRLCHEAALKAGISDPKAEVLAKMAHVSVKLIEYHVKTALAEGKEMGAAIYRIENNWRIEKTPARDKERVNLAGKYSDYVIS